MTVRELNRDQLHELKQTYYSELVNEGIFAEVMGVVINEPSYEMIASIDEYVSDEFIYEHYDGCSFTEDDFFCSAERVFNMLDITNLYAYRIEELAVGIVKAESYEDAREKVKAAYVKHNDCFDSERDFIELKKIVENDSWFSDNPDVVEIDDLI